MGFETREKTKNNILFGVLENVIKITCPFIIRTIIIRQLGANYIGINSLFTSVLSVLSLAELGFDTAIVCIMYEAVAKDDENNLCALLNFIKKVYYLVGGSICFMGCVCAPFIKYLINDPESIPKDINVYVIYFIFLFDTAIGYFLGAYRNTIVNAYQRRDIISIAYSISVFLTTIVQIFILLFIKNYTLYLVVKPLTTILQNLIVLSVSKKIFPNIKPEGILSNEIKERVILIVKGTFCGSIGAKLSVSFDNIIISSMLGISILSYYSNYSYIIAALQSFFLIISVSMKAAIGNKVNVDSVEKNYELLRILTLVFNWIDGWGTITLFYLIQKFITLWIGQEKTLPIGVVISFCIYFYISISDAIFQQFKEALGIFWEDRYRALAGGGLNLGLNIIMVILLRNIGLEYALAGVVLSTAISQIVLLTPWATRITFSLYFKNGKLAYYKQLINSFLATICCGIMIYPISKVIDFGVRNVYWNFLVTGLMCLIMPSCMLWFIYTKFEYYKETKNFLLRMVRK